MDLPGTYSGQVFVISPVFDRIFLFSFVPGLAFWEICVHNIGYHIKILEASYGSTEAAHCERGSNPAR